MKLQIGDFPKFWVLIPNTLGIDAYVFLLGADSKGYLLIFRSLNFPLDCPVSHGGQCPQPYRLWIIFGGE